MVTQAVGACRSRSASGVRIVAAGAGSRRQCVPTSSAAASAPPGLSSGRRDAGEAAAESASQRLGGQDALIQRVWLALRLPQAWDRIEYQPGGQGQKWSEAFAPRSQVEAMVAELEASSDRSRWRRFPFTAGRLDEPVVGNPYQDWPVADSSDAPMPRLPGQPWPAPISRPEPRPPP